MNEDIKTRKSDLRAQALRNRAALGLDPSGMQDVADHFFANITIEKGAVVAGYWPKDRELDVTMLLDVLLEKDVSVVLPIVEKDSRLLKFVKWDHQTPMTQGAFGIMHPVIDADTHYVEPDIFLVPMLAFDRGGGRLGFGGGYYDTTLAYYAARKSILRIGIAYAQQACLFNLPREDHDVKMDWVITEQQAHAF